jgi:chloramphenicol 3-O phosphotransferase
VSGAGGARGAGAGPAAGTAILLNGVTSAGKTTLARALRAVLPGPWFYVALDHFEAMLPDPLPAGYYERYAVPGLHRCAAALAAEGADVILDHVLTDGAAVRDAAARLGATGSPVLFVGVHCALPELERRERARGDEELRPLSAAAGARADRARRPVPPRWPATGRRLAAPPPSRRRN